MCCKPKLHFGMEWVRESIPDMGSFKKMSLFWYILSTQEAKFQIWYFSEFLVVLWPKYVTLNKITLGIHKKYWYCVHKFDKFAKKMTKKLFFEVYLTLTMPLNHVFRFLFKYGGWYLNCTYNYLCSPTKYENIWTNMG